MRIAWLIYGSLDLPTGGFFFDRQIVEGLRKRGHQVQVISLPWHRPGYALLRGLLGLDRAWLQEATWDVVVEDALVHPSLALRPPQPGAPRVALLHIPRAWLSPQGAGRLWAQWVEARYLRRVQGLATVSHANLRWARQRGFRGPAVVVRPGGDHLGASCRAEHLLARRRDLPPLRLLFVGQLVPRKGLHVLLQALEDLPPDAWTLDIVGDARWHPRYAQRWRAHVRRRGWDARVRWWGVLSHQEIRQRMLHAHALVVPSWAEGYALVYIEAMAAGLPVVAGKRGGGPELVRHGFNGFLVDPEQPEQVREALLTWLATPERWLAMAQAALATFHRHPTWRDAVSRFEEFLRLRLHQPDVSGQNLQTSSEALLV